MSATWLPGIEWPVCLNPAKPRRAVRATPAPAPRSILRLPGPVKVPVVPHGPVKAMRPKVQVVRRTIAPASPVAEVQKRHARAREGFITSDALHDLARRVANLRTDFRNPHRFFEDRSELSEALRKLARSV